MSVLDTGNWVRCHHHEQLQVNRELKTKSYCCLQKKESDESFTRHRCLPARNRRTSIEKNMESLATQIGIMRAYSPWIKLVCAPELCLQGPYHMEASAEKIPGPISDFCAELARKHEIFLIPGSLYEKEGQAIYNTAPVFNPQGKLIARYRKMYPWRPFEKTTSGSETVVFDVPDVGRVGVCICYDLWFPE